VQEKESSRKRDGIVLLVQDNALRSLSIRSVNETAANLLGYAVGDLDNGALSQILSSKTQSLLDEELEYTADAPDFGDIMSRQRTIRVKARAGDEMTLECRVLRVVADGENPRFHLILPDETAQRATQQRNNFLKTNLESHLERDEATNLPNRMTTENYLKLLKNYISGQGVSVAFATVRLDRFDSNLKRYGEQDMSLLLKHVASFCQATFRSEDVVSVLNPSTLGVILFDISRESARVVLNRLRGQVRSHRIAFGGKQDFSVTISVAFDMLGDDRGEQVLTRSEHAMLNLGKDARNSLIELTSD
jgi:diguanylate cyclase (GGDEF)-like protein